jgi:hypothetical protein
MIGSCTCERRRFILVQKLERPNLGRGSEEQAAVETDQGLRPAISSPDTSCMPGFTPSFE